MAYLLRTLILLMIFAIGLTLLVALGLIESSHGHIRLALITFLYTIFVQAFVMFYFIGVNRLMKNIYEVINTSESREHLNEIFENPPDDLKPYLKKTAKFVQDSNLCKRQTIPWTMLILTLGTLAFLLGAAHDTGLVERSTHSGVVYGFSAASLIGFFRQWHYLKVGHRLLQKAKGLYHIPHNQM